MSDFTLNLSSQVEQKASLQRAFKHALSEMVHSPYFNGDEITTIYQDTLSELKNELENKSRKCGAALSKTRSAPGTFLQENNLPYPYCTDDLINLS